MSRKWFIALPLLALELLLCAGVLVAFWGGYRWVQDRGLRITAFSLDTVAAQSDETQTYTVGEAATLRLDNTAGFVTVTGGSGREVVIQMHKTAWGENDADAQAALADLKVEITQTGDTLSVRVIQPAVVAVVGDQRGGSVDFTIEVPSDTALDLHTGFGAITASAVTNGVDLSTSSGAVQVEDVSGGALTLRSDFGDVTLTRASGDVVDAGSSSGAVRLSDVQAAGDVTLHTDFGAVRFEDGTADALSASTSSGSVTLTDLSVGGAVTAESDFGDLTVTRVDAAGGYDLGTSSGAVTLTGATGAVKAESGFGNVDISDATDVTLDVHTSSGRLTFAGSLGDGPHEVRTDFGDILLRLPADTAVTLDLGTDFGNISSALPISLTAGGDLDEDNWAGTLNGGGPRLTAHTSSGSIRIETLSA